MDQGHRVLQLVAEPERAARLIEPRAGPHAAGQRLIDEPTVGQEIDRRVGRFQMDHAQRPAPVIPHALDRPMGAVDAAEPLRQGLGLGRSARGADRKRDDPLLSVFHRQRRLQGGARIVARPDAAREPHAPHGRGAGQLAIAAQKLGAVAGQRAVRFAAVDKRHPVAELRAVDVAGENRAAGRIGLGHHVQQRLAPRVAEDQFPIAGDRQLSRTPRVVGDLELVELHRRVERHIDHQLRRQAFVGVSKML
jgi:hypothetical protein